MKFWNQKGLSNYLLFPLSYLYLLIHVIKFNLTRPKKVKAFVICIGNLTVGGTGKTPFAIALGKALQQDRKIAFILRGYKGKLSSSHPVKVSHRHTALEVGDEALLLSQVAPTYICTNRYASAFQAKKDGAEVIIMDDGFQNNTLHKDISILIFDGNMALGNDMLIPAGPLREPVSSALARADIIFFYNKTLPVNFTPVFKGKLVATTKAPANKSYAAMCGIGNPDKFYNLLKESGIKITKKFTYPDHHIFSSKEIHEMVTYACQHGLQILTTSKDYIRLPKTIPDNIFKVVEVSTQIPPELIEKIKEKMR